MPVWWRSIPLLPAICLLALFFVGPILWAFYGSFTNMALTGPHAQSVDFVGLDNFAYLLTRPSFHLVIFQSCLFAVTAVIMKAFIGFILAHLMHNIRGSNERIWRGLLLVPWVIPLSLSTLTWWWLFDPEVSFQEVLVG